MVNQYGGQMPDAIGIPEEMLREAAAKAVCKINVDSDLRLAMTATVRKYFAENPSHFPASIWVLRATPSRASWSIRSRRFSAARAKPNCNASNRNVCRRLFHCGKGGGFFLCIFSRTERQNFGFGLRPFLGEPFDFRAFGQKREPSLYKLYRELHAIYNFPEKLSISIPLIFAFWLVMFVRIRYNCY